jgi:hypothetical protein
MLRYLTLPLTGGLGVVGMEVQAGAKLYVQRHGTTVAGKKIARCWRAISASPPPAPGAGVREGTS